MAKAIRWTPEQLQAHQKRLNRFGEPTPGRPKGAKAHRPNKYGAIPVNGYASGRESKRAAELRLLAAAGAITDLKEQVRYELIPAQYVDGKCVERACTYVADFCYTERGVEVVEDCKGVRTPEYRIKRKLFLQRYGVRIRET